VFAKHYLHSLIISALKKKGKTLLSFYSGSFYLFYSRATRSGAYHNQLKRPLNTNKLFLLGSDSLLKVCKQTTAGIALITVKLYGNKEVLSGSVGV